MANSKEGVSMQTGDSHKRMPDCEEPQTKMHSLTGNQGAANKAKVNYNSPQTGKK